MLKKIVEELAIRMGKATILTYDGDEYGEDMIDIVISDGYIESRRSPAPVMAKMAKITKKYVVISWKNLHNFTNIRKTETGYNNIYCEKEMRILGSDCGLKIKKKHLHQGRQIWILEKSLDK